MILENEKAMKKFHFKIKKEEVESFAESPSFISLLGKVFEKFVKTHIFLDCHSVIYYAIKI